MATKEQILAELDRLLLPDGRGLAQADMVRAVTVDGGAVRFVIEAASPEDAAKMEPIRKAAVELVEKLDGVESASAVLTAHGAQAAPKAPPKLSIGGHPDPKRKDIRPKGVKRIIAVGSGKGGVGKSTVSVNLAVALARAGQKVGLLDADFYGPSQPRMMGVSARPGQSPDGLIVPPEAHGLKMMSLGLMVDEKQAVVWRGPMLMGAVQQMLGEVDWGELDVLVIDLPPGTGDVQLTLGQQKVLDGAVIVSTPQDVALIDARKAIDMFEKLKVPVIGLIENMSLYICPKCGHEAHLFGHGGVGLEAERLGAPLLAQLPIDLDTRLGGDAGQPVAAGESAAAAIYADLAQKLI
ncbi:Mrp/NBP35 family ATP-binding protein [Lentibacter sp. XHP0401]|uniref:Mrp/NBP35 family ATP-binding protein n=1 Tax=Lentibacter sp. XHP0401 TaxID=2984334 RepID=UPI0021E91183|nr:Mrp/NBP35 family ATP-binding protein [Lentibacter sp. XHP0401]MCV2893319.1 Mrp/NBP35 family ATP-binding protein [Lentibacter sp. XHP0401]